MTPLQMTLFAIACLLIGLSKGGLGGPLPVALVTPMLALVMDAKEAVPLVLPFLIFADWFALRAYWQEWDTDLLKLLVPAALVGALMGGLLLSVISDFWLKITIGVFTILVIVYKLVSDRLASVTYEHRNWHGYLAGWSTALASTLANTGAPTFTIYLLLQRVESITFIGTATLFFTIVNLLKLPIFIQQDLLQVSTVTGLWWALPIVPLGVWIGRRVLDYIDQTTFERIMMILLFLSVILLFATL
ncbi:MAG: sulfite exporter TauE/SafE family protein [Chloroflexota bacterium]